MSQNKALLENPGYQHLIDPYSRYQKNLSLEDMFPTPTDGTCSCGCGVMLTGRQTRWATRICVTPLLIEFYIIQGNTEVIRNLLFEEDAGHCRSCGVYDKLWQADHIIEVRDGGGGCDLDNFQTLCIPCHKDKTKSHAS